MHRKQEPCPTRSCAANLVEEHVKHGQTECNVRSFPKALDSVLFLRHRFVLGCFGQVWVYLAHPKDTAIQHFRQVLAPKLGPIKDVVIHNHEKGQDGSEARALGLETVLFIAAKGL